MGISEPQDATTSNTPKDESGDGPVTLEDRIEPGGEGSPGSNQAAEAEPPSPSGNRSERLAVPDLGEMNVGGADPQAPRHPDALLSQTSSTGAYAHEPAGQPPSRLSGEGHNPDEVRPEPDLTSSTGRAPGPEQPLQESTGTAHRAPGQQGSTPEGESVTSDTSAGAARMAPQAPGSTAGQSPGQGDDATVPSSGTAPTPGTSEEHRIVSGIKLPQDDGA
jgi:hypothetical protein